MGLEHRRQGHSPGGNLFGIFLDAVFEWVSRGHERGVRGQREGDLRVDVGEDLAVGIDVGGFEFSVAVGAEVVGAEGVDGDEDDRGGLRGGAHQEPGERG